MVNSLEAGVVRLGIAPLEQLVGMRTNGAETLLRQNFANSRVVVVDCDSFGLGDSVIEVRHTLALARKVPDKTFVVCVPQAVTEITYFTRPANVTFVAGVSEEYLYKNSTFFMSFSPGLGMEQTMMMWWDDERSINKILRLSATQKIYKPARAGSTLGFNEYFYIEAGINNRGDINILDVLMAAKAAELGVYYSAEELDVPLLNFDGADLNYLPQSDQLLIAPDAKEVSVEGRSLKSFSVNHWREILGNLNRRLNLGIIIGTAHPEYCLEVAAVVNELGFNATSVVTPTLNHFIRRVLTARVFIGMDSGTTHLAYEVATAAESCGRKVSIAEVFLSERGAVEQDTRFREYAIRGHRFPVLRCTGLYGYNNDGGPILAAEIAQFIEAM